MSRGIMSNSLMNAAAGMLLLVTGFCCSVLVARLLGPEANGTIAFALWIGATGSLVAELGTGILLMRLLPQMKARGADDALRRGFAAYLVLPVLASTLVLAGLYYAVSIEAEILYGTEVEPGIVLLTGALLFIQSLGAFSKNYLIGEQRLGTFLRITALSAALQFAVVLAGALFFGVMGALAGYIAGQSVQFLYTLRLLAAPRNNGGYSPRFLAATSAVLFMEFAVSAIFLSRPELFFLQQFRTVAEVGFYAVALSLANLALQLPVQLTGSLIPFYAQRRENGGGGQAEVFEAVVRSFAYITFPLCFGLAAISLQLVPAIYGEAFGPAGLMVAILAAGSPAYVFVQLVTQYLYSMDRVRERLMASGLGALLMVGGCVLVVPSFGGAGAATMRGVVFAVMGALLLASLGRGAISSSLAFILAKVALAAGGCGLAAWLVAENLGGLGGVAAGVAAGTAAYAVLLRLLRAVPREDGATIDRLLGSVPAIPARALRRMLALIVPQPAHQPAGE